MNSGVVPVEIRHPKADNHASEASKMNTDIQTLEQILNRILNTKPADKAQDELLSKAYSCLLSAIAALEKYQAQ
ncbi:hypothetical protein H6F75_16005 [Nodosilinea sp. FACHB-131]|uniref:hypothetical protein n=1 Tax=Cyanophyceae TaxID=3028117 RepID=UPI00199B229F|nr:hypothetical protein [Nodosilinea sp. FACHB-131]MBD1874992.1 hypothetical protein [Nodosilinea sp. FACHB-131]